MKTNFIIIIISALLFFNCQNKLYIEDQDVDQVELRSGVMNGIQKYNFPPRTSNDIQPQFSVQINGENHYVYPVFPSETKQGICGSNETVIPEIVSFGIQDNVTTTLIIKREGKHLNKSNCVVRPKSRLVNSSSPANNHYSVSYRSDGILALTITGPQMLCVEITGDLFLKPLLVFANELETYIPDKSNWSGTLYEFKAGTIKYVSEVVNGSLKSNDMVYIAPGAIVKGEFYTENNATNVQIRGRGIITGYKNESEKYKSLITVNGGSNTYIEGVTLANNLNWVVALYGNNNSTIERIRVVSMTGYDDGIDLVGCQNINVLKSFVMSKDDGIVIKAGCRYLPFSGGSPTNHGDQDVSDINIRNCMIWNGRSGNALEIGCNLNTKSVKRITYDYIEILHALNCTSYQGKGGYQAAMSIVNTGEAVVDGVTYKNIYIEHVENQLINLFVREDALYSPSNKTNEHGLSSGYTQRTYKMGEIKNIYFQNIFVDRAGKLSSSIMSNGPLDEKTNVNKIDNINIKGLYINGQKINSYSDTEIDENKNGNKIHLMYRNFNPSTQLKFE